MTPAKKKERAKRATAMLKVLNSLYPTRQGTALTYKTPWELLVSTVLSAQCTDKRVNMVTPALFKKYKTVRELAKAKPRELETLIRSTGFYKNKAKNILAAAKLVVKNFDGVVPSSIDELLTLPGVGRKTAVVLLANAFDQGESGLAVDTHVKRFAARFDLSDHKDPGKIEQDLMKLLPQKDWFDFHNKIIYYGREVCPARPHDCIEHPLTNVFPKAAKNWPKAR